MSDLLSLLSLGSAGITAQNTGVSVATNNVANANTEGYSRQRVDLEALIGSPLVGGVRSNRPDRFQDSILGGRIRTAAGSLALSRAFHSALTDVETRLSSGGPTVAEQLATMFAKVTAASAAPTDPVARKSAIDATHDLVAGIHRRAADLTTARAETNERIRANVATASDLARRLADTNLAIAKTNDPVMRDERDLVAAELSSLVGGQARIDPDGQMRFVLEGGAVLVDGRRAATLATSPDPTTGDQIISVIDGAQRRDVTASLSSGSIGADRVVRDTTISRSQRDLDQLAFDTVSSLNVVHAANSGLDGISGRLMFGTLAQVAGAASSISIDPALAADPGVLALGAPGAGPGSNAGALAFAAVANQPVASGNRTLTGAALDMISVVATEAARSGSDVRRDELVAGHLAGLRDSLAGVDMQEELTNLARFEHASSAMTRFVSTIDGLLGDLIDRL